MATQTFFHPLSPAVSLKDRSGFSNPLRSILLMVGLLLFSVSARAQLQQAFAFAANTNGPGPGILVYTRNDITGVLTPVPGSPFPSRAPVNGLALDFKGRFLFVATSENNIEMFAINPNSGALQEVPTLRSLPLPAGPNFFPRKAAVSFSTSSTCPALPVPMSARSSPFRSMLQISI